VDRDNVQAKLDLATALSHLGQGAYEKAAQYFLKVGAAKDLGDWVGKVLSVTHNNPHFYSLPVDSSSHLAILRSMAPSPRSRASPGRPLNPES